MNKILIILLTILLFYADGMSQNIKTKSLDEKCKCRATLMDSIVNSLKNNNGQPMVNSNVRNNPIEVKERINFLNSDFVTDSFASACEVKCADFFYENGFHLGIIDIGIRFKDKKKCLKAIELSSRQNFKTKVLTKFKVIERSHELVVLYSETPDDPAVKKIFDTSK